MDLDILRTVERSAQVEVFYIKISKFGALSGEGAVDHELESFEGCRVGPDISRVANVCATDGYVGAIGVCFARAHFTYDRCVAYFFELFRWNIFKFDDMKRVGAFDSFSIFFISLAHTLTKLSHFIGEGVVPCGGEAWMAAELAIGEKFSSVSI